MMTAFDVTKGTLINGFNHSIQYNKLIQNSCPIDSLLSENHIKDIKMEDSYLNGQTRMTIVWQMRTGAEVEISLLVSLMRDFSCETSLLKIMPEDSKQCTKLINHSMDDKPHHRSNAFSALKERLSTFNRTVGFEYVKFVNQFLAVDGKYINQTNPKRDIISISSTVNGTRPYNIDVSREMGGYMYSFLRERLSTILADRDKLNRKDTHINSIMNHYAKHANIIYCPVTDSVWLRFSNIADTLGEFSTLQSICVFGNSSSLSSNRKQLKISKTNPEDTKGIIDDWLVGQYANRILCDLPLTSLSIIRELHKYNR